jgi:8-oxo-dGTP pyrophosphatase MutT (NUDIX family)
VEPDDPEIWDAARRETIEETGAELLPDPAPVLAGMDVHGIPPKRGEPYHLHHDLIFAFRAAGEEVRVSPESRAVIWCPPSDFDHFLLPDSLRRAYRRILQLNLKP